MNDYMNKYDLNIMRYDVLFNKYKTMSEMCDMQTLQNYRESKLKVIAESGTIEDLGWLYKEAAEENEAKQKNIIKRMIDALIKFIQSVLDKLRGLFSKTEEEVQELPPEEKSFFAKLNGVLSGAAASVVSFGNSIVDGCKQFVRDVLAGDKKASALALGCGAAVAGAITYGGLKGYNYLKRKSKAKSASAINSAVKNISDQASDNLSNDDSNKHLEADLEIDSTEADDIANDIVNGVNKGTEVTGAKAADSQKKTEKIIASIKEIAKSFGDKIKDSKLAQHVSSILQTIIKHLQEAGSKISSFVGGMIDKAKSHFGKSKGADATKEESAFDHLFDDDFDLFDESDDSHFGNTKSEFDDLFDDFNL